MKGFGNYRALAPEADYKKRPQTSRGLGDILTRFPLKKISLKEFLTLVYRWGQYWENLWEIHWLGTVILLVDISVTSWDLSSIEGAHMVSEIDHQASKHSVPGKQKPSKASMTRQFYSRLYRQSLRWSCMINGGRRTQEQFFSRKSLSFKSLPNLRKVKSLRIINLNPDEETRSRYIILTVHTHPLIWETMNCHNGKRMSTVLHCHIPFT